ncbi:MAG: hypothetical protein WCI17_07385 [bacterium]
MKQGVNSGGNRVPPSSGSHRKGWMSMEGAALSAPYLPAVREPVAAGAPGRAGPTAVRRPPSTVRPLLLFLLLAAALHADTVTWSNGRTWEGQVELADLVRLHDGRRVRSWGADEIAEIVFTPATQRMERAWVFKEAGKTAKELSGEPYPTLELQSSVALRSGEIVGGHLLTTAFYLSAGNRTEKLVLKFKLRGQEGQSVTDVVYAARIRFGPAPSAAAASPRACITVAGAGAGTELALISRARMQEAEIRRSGTNSFQIRIDGGDIVPAVRTGNTIAVGWGGRITPAARSRIEQGLRDLKDFFDDRQLLACSQDPSDETTCHTLLLLTRSARTTLDGPSTQPWRLEVWKWRLGADPGDITAATRGVLFRGIRSPDAPLPAIRIDSGLRPIERLVDGLTIQL